MKNVLIFGGTRYLGKLVAEQLIELKYSVTIFSRSNPFVLQQQGVNFIQGDRKNKADLLKLSNRHFDFVIDFINFSSFDSSTITWLEKEKIISMAHYIFISSSFVYLPENHGLNITEEMFSPYDYSFEIKDRPLIDYNEGKRLSESFLCNTLKANLTIIRFPPILCSQDYTGRFRFFYDLIKENKRLKDLGSTQFQIIYSHDAKNFIINIIQKNVFGIFNYSTRETLTEKSIYLLYKESFDDSLFTTLENERSDFNFKYSLTLDCTKGYKILKPTPFRDWFYKEIGLIN